MEVLGRLLVLRLGRRLLVLRLGRRLLVLRRCRRLLVLGRCGRLLVLGLDRGLLILDRGLLMLGRRLLMLGRCGHSQLLGTVRTINHLPCESQVDFQFIATVRTTDRYISVILLRHGI